jgi:Ca2+-binding RTX toxin-like protein
MEGGSGDDTYHLLQAIDHISEGVGQGIDTVISAVDFYLPSEVENLTLADGTGDLYGVGNELANLLNGNEGGNLLIGWDGNDTVNGGAGNDNLFGVEGDDVLKGQDGIDYLVGGNGNDVLDGGDQADALYGEDGNDALWGGSDFVTDILVAGNGDDFLHGDSGQGDYDLMDGGAGNDTYFVDTPADLTFEAVGGGTDTVIANIVGAGYYLYANVENLILQGATPYGVGNELDNVLTGSNQVNWLLGGAGADTLDGKAGNDVLFGEAGADTFVFEAGTGGDVIGDFQAGVD